MRIGRSVVITVAPADLQVYGIRKIPVLRPDAVRNIGAPDDDTGMPAVAGQVDRFARFIRPGRRRCFCFRSSTGNTDGRSRPSAQSVLVPCSSLDRPFITFYRDDTLRMAEEHRRRPTMLHAYLRVRSFNHTSAIACGNAGPVPLLGLLSQYIAAWPPVSTNGTKCNAVAVMTQG